MHFYWRIFEELKWMGEFMVVRDPSLRRCFEAWLSNHAEAIAYQYGWPPENGSGPTIH